MANISFVVAEITFKVASVADISLFVAMITFAVSEINIKEAVITSLMISTFSVIYIDRAITQYTLFGNGGTNLHKNGTWDSFSAC